MNLSYKQSVIQGVTDTEPACTSSKACCRSGPGLYKVTDTEPAWNVVQATVVRDPGPCKGDNTEPACNVQHDPYGPRSVQR